VISYCLRIVILRSLNSITQPLPVNFKKIKEMNTKKTLKKLKKKAKKTSSQSLKQLKNLAKIENTPESSYRLRAELQNVSQQALVSALSELTTPLNPILSWFNEGNTSSHRVNQFHSAGLSPPVFKDVASQKISLTTLPLKSPPCKRCPALTGGRCKCAMKKIAV
jgi:hypothetical protein